MRHKVVSNKPPMTMMAQTSSMDSTPERTKLGPPQAPPSQKVSIHPKEVDPKTRKTNCKRALNDPDGPNIKGGLHWQRKILEPPPLSPKVKDSTIQQWMIEMETMPPREGTNPSKSIDLKARRMTMMAQTSTAESTA